MSLDKLTLKLRSVCGFGLALAIALQSALVAGHFHAEDVLPVAEWPAFAERPGHDSHHHHDHDGHDFHHDEHGEDEAPEPHVETCALCHGAASVAHIAARAPGLQTPTWKALKRAVPAWAAPRGPPTSHAWRSRAPPILR